MIPQISELDLFTKNRVKVALPLKPQPDCELNPEPNFLIIENIWMEDNQYKALFPPGHPSAALVECARARMRLVYRELLPAEGDKPATMREVMFDDMETIDFPEEYFPMLINQSKAIKAERLINSLLPMFQFRGILKNYKLEFDAAKSQKFLDDTEAKRLADEEAKNQVGANGQLIETLPQLPQLPNTQ